MKTCKRHPDDVKLYCGTIADMENVSPNTFGKSIPLMYDDFTDSTYRALYDVDETDHMYIQQDVQLNRPAGRVPWVRIRNSRYYNNVINY